jgi:hypothetical protein
MEIDNLITGIQDKLKTFKKEEKLYYMIYDFLTKENELKNYSTNKTGIRFKLYDFDIQVLHELIQIIDDYTVNQSHQKDNIDFTEEIKVKKPKKIKKI